MKSMLYVVLTSLVLSLTANAEGRRVLVVMKSKQAFYSVDSAYRMLGGNALKGFSLGFAAAADVGGV